MSETPAGFRCTPAASFTPTAVSGTMTKRSAVRVVVAIAVALATVASAIVVTRHSHSLAVSYHVWRMNRNWDRTFSHPTDDLKGLKGYTLGEHYEAYQYHRGKLMSLGTVVERQYDLKNLKSRTDASRHFDHLWMSRSCPPFIEAMSPFPDEVGPKELTVWCYSGDVDAWDQFIDEHDVADYDARFLSNQKSAAVIE